MILGLFVCFFECKKEQSHLKHILTMSKFVRIAPSPTGRLHVGNLRSAVFNWLEAKKNGGTFLLRIDDTDLARSTKENDQGIQDDLTWLGVTWDRLERQSERFARYEIAAEKLKADGRLYPCYESEEELSLKRKSLLSRGKSPVYDRASLKLTDEEKKALEAKGIKPYWRFLLNHEMVSWEDGIRGPVSISAAEISDPVLIRADGSWLYTFTSCVDDIELGITDIIRGEDHVTNAAAQIQIFEALGGPVPTFTHFPLIVGKEGDKLSKRIGSLSVPNLRDEFHLEPMTLWSYLAHLGTSDPIEPQLNVDVLVKGFDLKKVSRTPPKFDTDELMRLNARILHMTPWSSIAKRVHEDLSLPQADEAFWKSVQANIVVLPDVKDWWHITREAIGGVIAENDRDFITLAADVLPPEPWTTATWDAWINALKAKTDRKGKDLFMPLRLALTAREHGPELKTLLPLIGRNRVLARLKGEEA